MELDNRQFRLGRDDVRCDLIFSRKAGYSGPYVGHGLNSLYVQLDRGGFRLWPKLASRLVAECRLLVFAARYASRRKGAELCAPFSLVDRIRDAY
jgi:hypothetical protein